MEIFGNESEDTRTRSQVISGLPDDVAVLCLARVPRKYHSVLRCVSRRWRDLVCSEEWHAYRRKHNLEETWVYALCRDKLDQLCCYVLDPKSKMRCWKVVQGLPSQCSRRKGLGFEVLGTRLYLLGGCGWIDDATDEVYCYDALKEAWDRPASLPTARCYFACEALDQKLYTIGGMGSMSSDPLSWDTYDPHSKCWESHSEPISILGIEDSVVMDGKIYIRCSSSSNLPPLVHSVVYDPSSGIWQNIDKDMVSGWRGPAVVVDETLYVLDQSSGTRLMMWEKESREWIAMGRLSLLLTKPPCQLAAVGNSIFIIGKGLSTVVFDVGNGGKMGGVMVSSSIPGLPSIHDVISCKAVSL